MREQHGLYGVAVYAQLLEGDQRGRATIDQQVCGVSLQMEAGVESAPAAEGIATADELKLHGLSPSRQHLQV